MSIARKSLSRGAFPPARVALPLLVALAVAGPSAARDNFLVISIDDVGVDKIGIYSDDLAYGHPGEGASPGPTPTIDALAAEGVLFRNAYTNPGCAPTRASTLTGRYALRTGIGAVQGANLPLSETLLPEILAGTHVNAAVGKWHIGPGGDVDHPTDSGFDRFAGSLGGGLPSYTNWNKVTDGVLQSGVTTYATTDAADEAAARIQEFGASPWFIWLAFNAPHTPYHAPVPSTLHTQSLSGNPNQSPVPHYAAALEAADTEIARLLAGIPQDVLDDTTIILFGDNGTARQAVELPFLEDRAKGSMYEGGINVPFIVKSPHVPMVQRGSESLELVQTVDVFATLADIAGVASAAEDSISFLPILQNPAGAGNRSIAYTESFGPNGFGPYTSERRTALDGRYKIIWREGSVEEMFDLETDPFEQTNLLLGTLDAQEQAAYDVLFAEIARLQGFDVPAASDASRLLLASALAALAIGTVRRSGS